jgi:hypothetical protein
MFAARNVGIQMTVEVAGVRGFGWGLCNDIQIIGLTKDT